MAKPRLFASASSHNASNEPVWSIPNRRAVPCEPWAEGRGRRNELVVAPRALVQIRVLLSQLSHAPQLVDFRRLIRFLVHSPSSFHCVGIVQRAEDCTRRQSLIQGAKPLSRYGFRLIRAGVGIWLDKLAIRLGKVDVLKWLYELSDSWSGGTWAEPGLSPRLTHHDI